MNCHCTCRTTNHFQSILYHTQPPQKSRRGEGIFKRIFRIITLLWHLLSRFRCTHKEVVWGTLSRNRFLESAAIAISKKCIIVDTGFLPYMARTGDGRCDVASTTPNVDVPRMAVSYRRDVFPIVFACLRFHVLSPLLLPRHFS